MSDKIEMEERLPVAEERLTVRKRKVETDTVRVRAVPEEIERRVPTTVTYEDVVIERVPIGREVEQTPEVRQEGDTWVFPVVEQVLTLEKRSVLKEEVRVHKRRRSETAEQAVTLRSTRVIVERGEHTGDETPEHKLKEITMATRTLTALFDSRAQAEHAQQELIDTGISPASIHVMDQSTTQAAESSPGIWGKVKNIFLPEEDRHIFQEGVRRGGAIVAVEVEQEQVDRTITTLQECNAVDLDQRQAQWRSTGWTGWQAPTPDTSRPAADITTQLSGDGSRPSKASSTREGIQEGTREEVIPVAEEQLRIGKREIDRGGVRVRSYIVEEPVRESVTLRDEHVDVERRPVDRPATAADRGDLLKERSVEMHATAEEPVIQKDARVKEEVVVRKSADERVEQVEDKVRRTKVDVEKDDQRMPGDGQRMPPPGPVAARPEGQQPPRH